MRTANNFPKHYLANDIFLKEHKSFCVTQTDPVINIWSCKTEITAALLAHGLARGLDYITCKLCWVINKVSSSLGI